MEQSYALVLPFRSQEADSSTRVLRRAPLRSAHGTVRSVAQPIYLNIETVGKQHANATHSHKSLIVLLALIPKRNFASSSWGATLRAEFRAPVAHTAIPMIAQFKRRTEV